MLLLYPWLWWCLEGMSSPRRFSKTSLNVRRYVWRSSTEKVGRSTFDSSWFGDFDAWATERSSDVRYYNFWGIVYLSQKYWYCISIGLNSLLSGKSGVDNLTSFGFPCYKRTEIPPEVGFPTCCCPPENSWTSRHLNGSMVAWLMRFPVGISGHEG